MKYPMLTAVVGTALTATAAQAGPLPDSMYTTSAMIPQEDIDVYWEARAEAEARRGDGARSLLSAARGGVYALRDTFDSYPNLCDVWNQPGGYTFGGTLNPEDSAWQSVPFGGVVDNSCAEGGLSALFGGTYNGPAGGPDPSGLRGRMLHVQRSSVLDSPTDEGSGVETYEYFSNFYTASHDRPLFVEIDIYKPDHETFMWFRPVSYTWGCFVTGILMGGHQSSGLFVPLAQLHEDPALIEGAVILANVADYPAQGEFVLNPKIIPEGGWFTLGLLMTPNYMQILVRDSETLADNDTDGSPDWKMPMNQVTGLRMFEELGYGIEEGWASILPGTLDDPMTTDIEGAGYAVNAEGAVTDRFFFNGNDVASIFSKYAIDSLRLYHGNDAFATLPGYEMKDWWWDDYRIRGVRTSTRVPPPDQEIPYVDDFEGWGLGTLPFQAGATWAGWGFSNIEVVEGINHTPSPARGDGAPSQSLRFLNATTPYSARRMIARGALPLTPRVRAETGDPVVLSAALRFESSLIPLGVRAFESSVEVWGQSRASEALAVANERVAGYVWTSAADSNGMGDGRVYVRQRKPLGTDIAGGEFDLAGPRPVLEGPHLTPDQEAAVNTPFINVLAAPSGQSELTLAPDAWHVFRLELEPGAGARGAGADPHTLRVFVSENDGPLVELFPDGDDSRRFTTNALAPRLVELSMPITPLGGFVRAYADDIFFDGPRDTDTLVPLAPSFADDPAWVLPFTDPLDTYEKGRPATPQGSAEYRLEFMPTENPALSPEPNDWDEIEFIAGAAPLANGEPVRVYRVESVEAGAPGFGAGDAVAVRDDVLSDYAPNSSIFGVIDDGSNSPNEWYVLDAINGSEIARGTWFLDSVTGEALFDDVAHIDLGARFSYRQDFRYTGEEGGSEFVSASAEGVEDARGSRGDVVRLTNTGSIREYTHPNTFFLSDTTMFGGLFPLAQITKKDQVAVLGFDVYIPQNTFGTGFYATFDGGTSSGGEITAIGFGGAGLQSGNALGGEPPYTPLGNLSYLVPNPNPVPGEPRNLWVDTGVATPTDQWLRVELALAGDSTYTISVDGVEIASGTAIDADEPQANTTSLDNVSFVRNQFGASDGRPTPGVVSWSARPLDAAALSSDHHFFRLIGDVVAEPGQTIPQVWRVDDETGEALTDGMGMPVTRELREDDVIALPNVDPDGGQPFDVRPLGSSYAIVSGARGTTVATGEWLHLGLAGQVGSGFPDPASGVMSGATPPYNGSVPFETMLLGSYESVGPTTLLPPDVWYVDNIELSLRLPCPGDLDGAGDAVNAGDLAVLLAAWGTTDPDANLDGVGVVDSGDLAILLAAWGPCP